jgi:hypothetical protein
MAIAFFLQPYVTILPTIYLPNFERTNQFTILGLSLSSALVKVKIMGHYSCLLTQADLPDISA